MRVLSCSIWRWNRKVDFNASMKQIHIHTVTDLSGVEEYFHCVFFCIFFISLGCYCLHDHRFEWVNEWERKEGEKKKIYNKKHGREWFSFVAFCVLNKCQKVIPHSVITWSFFSTFQRTHLRSHIIFRMETDRGRKKAKLREKCRDSLELNFIHCFSSYFFHLSRWVYLEMYFISFF